MSITAERLKAIRLERQVRRCGGIVLLIGDRLQIFGPARRMPKPLVAEVMGAKGEMARYIRNDFEERMRE